MAGLRLAAVLLAVIALINATQRAAGQAIAPAVRLSQIYAGSTQPGKQGGFVELFNASDATITLQGWQLAYSTRNAEKRISAGLDTLVLPPHRYALVALSSDPTPSALPPPDLTISLTLNLKGGVLSVINGSALADLVGYGDAARAEEAAAPALSIDAALLRSDGGCRDTDNNQADFSLAPPAPRNSHADSNVCPTPPPLATDAPPPAQSLTLTPPIPTPPTPTPPATSPAPDPPLPSAVQTPGEPPAAGPAEPSTATLTAIATATATAAATATATATATTADSLPPSPTATVLPTVPSPVPPTAPPDPPTPTDPPHTTDPPSAAPEPTTATPEPSSTPSPAPQPTATMTPVATATLSATPAPPVPSPGDRWQPRITASPLQIEEVAPGGAGSEYVVLLNNGSEPLTLNGWLLGDAQRPGSGEGLYALPAEKTLLPGQLWIAARLATSFAARFDRWPDAVFEAEDATWPLPDPIPVLARRTDLAHGRLALDDGGDEVVLIAPDGSLADAIAYGSGDYGALGLTGVLHARHGASLQRVPGAQFPLTADVRHRFMAAAPQPFALQGLPAAAAPPGAALADGYTALWGTLGAQSSFGEDGLPPPHAVLAASAAHGLNFAAIADPGVAAQPVLVPPDFIFVSAWRWRGNDKAQAIVYDPLPLPGLPLGDLAGSLAERASPIQWVGTAPGPSTGLSAVTADDVSPQSLSKLFARWHEFGAPLLPAGNAMPGAAEPRFTGLAVLSPDAIGVQEALAAGRGWLTSRPGLQLTLRSATPQGDVRWMGSWLPPANAVALEVEYGDQAGAGAHLALYADGALLAETDAAQIGGAWQVTVAAAPGAALAAVAVQDDGSFAITAPLMVADGGDGTVLLNEVLPAPHKDANSDGVVDTRDEFIELYNPGQTPVSLAGWQVGAGDPADSHRHYTFGAGTVIKGGDYLVLWRSDSRLALNNQAGQIFLRAPDGTVRDQAGWDKGLPAGRTVARLFDGQGWFTGADVTPGSANSNIGRGAGWGREPGTGFVGDPTPASNPYGDLPPVPTLEPSYGQAGGEPGSVAQGKLAGLDASVSVRGVVVVPPGRFTSAIYVADPAGMPFDTLAALDRFAAGGAAPRITAGIGVRVYLRHGNFPALAEGDLVLLNGRWDSYHGEMELVLEQSDQVWKLGCGPPLTPLTVAPTGVGESVEGRLVTVTGVVMGWDDNSIFLGDPVHPASTPVNVTVSTTLGWPRPHVERGETWRVTGVVSQYARSAPFNGGYRVLVRQPEDMVQLSALQYQ